MSAAPSVHVLVLGGTATGVAIVERVLTEYDDVLFLDPDPKAVEAAAALGATAEVVAITDGRALEAALPGGAAIELAIVSAEPDATALLVGQLAKTKFDARAVIALVRDPHNRVAFETAGMIPVCATTALSEAVVETVSLALQRDPDLQSAETTTIRTTDRPRTRRSV